MGYSIYDITADETQLYILANPSPSTVIVTTHGGTRVGTAEWSPEGGGTFNGIEHHQDYFYILGAGGAVQAWAANAVATMPPDRADGRDFSVSFPQPGQQPRAIGAYYSVSNMAWTEIVTSGPAGQRGPTGATGQTGAAGMDATVDAPSVLTAIQAFSPTQDTAARTALGVPEVDSASVLTAMQGFDNTQEGQARAAIAVPAVDAPTVLSALQGFTTGQEGQARTALGIDGAVIVSLLVGLAGTARLPATAVRDLPAGGGGGLTTQQVNALIAAYGQPFSTAEESKLAGIEADATADQTAADIVALLQGLSGNDRLQAAAIRGLATTLLDLTDTPNTYTGAGGDYLAVNAGATAVEFVDAPTGGGGQPPATHTRYAAASADTTFTADEFTQSATTDTLTLPNWTPAIANAQAADMYVAFAVPNSTGDITGIHPVGNSFNQIGGFSRVSGTLQISGQPYKVWRSNSAFVPRTRGSEWVITQAA